MIKLFLNLSHQSAYLGKIFKLNEPAFCVISGHSICRLLGKKSHLYAENTLLYNMRFFSAGGIQYIAKNDNFFYDNVKDVTSDNVEKFRKTACPRG